MTRSRSVRWPPTSPRSAPTSSTPTCTAPRPSRHGRSSRSARPASGGRTSSPRPIRAGSAPRRTAPTLLELTPQFDQLIAVSKASETKLIDEGRATVPISLIYNGVDLQRYDHQEPCCTLPEEYGMEPGSQIVGVVARLEPEKGHPTLLEAWPGVLRAVPGRLSADRRRGQPARRARGAGARAADRPSGRLHRAPRRRAGRDRRARRRGPAVLSRGAGPDDPRGDGAVTTGRRVERRRHPGDDRGRRHRAARPAARRGGADGGHRPAADRPPVRRHARPGGPRPRPRPVLHRADGRRGRVDLRRGRPAVRPSGVAAV